MNHKAHKTLKQVENERAAEVRKAEKFVRESELGSLPGKRSETGESDGRQRVGGDHNREVDGLPRLHRDNLSYSQYEGGPEQFEEDHPEARFITVGAAIGALDYDEVEKRARMNHVYSFLRDEQVDLLRKWGIEGMTLEGIAAEESVSKQAVHKRLAKAKAAFVAAFEAHWNEFPLDDFPVEEA